MSRFKAEDMLIYRLQPDRIAFHTKAVVIANLWISSAQKQKEYNLSLIDNVKNTDSKNWQREIMPTTNHNGSDLDDTNLHSFLSVLSNIHWISCATTLTNNQKRISYYRRTGGRQRKLDSQAKLHPKTNSDNVQTQLDHCHMIVIVTFTTKHVWMTICRKKIFAFQN